VRLLPAAIRRLIRAPAFTAVSIIVSAIGVAALTTVFSVVHAVLLQPLPYPEPDRLVGVWHKAPGVGVPDDSPMSVTQWVTYAEGNRTFESIGLWSFDAGTIREGQRSRQLTMLVVTPGTLDALGVAPAIGRLIANADVDPASESTVILTHGFWQRAYGGKSDAVGRTLTIDDQTHRVIGVMPGEFEFLDRPVDAIVPFRFDRRRLELGNFSHQGLGRLRPGVSLAAANADLSRLLPVWLNAWPSPAGVDRRLFESARITTDVRPLTRAVVGDIGPALWLLFGTVGLVLLIACANVANLFLVRAEHRVGELSIRLALGARWLRLARELFAESISIAAAGGALGMALSAGASRVIVLLVPDNLPRAQHIGIDGSVLAFAVVATLLVAGLIALAPLLRLRRLTAPVHQRTMAASRSPVQRTLVVVQAALAVLLLIGASLMTRTSIALRTVQPGFTDADTIQLLHIVIPDREVADNDRAIRTAQAMRERLAAIGGVDAVAFASSGPLEDFATTDVLFAEEHPLPDGVLPPVRSIRFIGPGTFRASGTRLVAGRDLTWDDLYQHHDVALVSDSLALELWGSAARALRKRVRSVPGEPWREVVGVVEDVHDSGLHQPPTKTVYWPALMADFGGNRSFASRGLTFIVRSHRAGSASLVDDAGRAITAINGNVPVALARTVGDLYRRSLARTSFTLVMLSIAASIALLLAIVGLYAVMAYAVTRRTREIGIRVALGSPRHAITTLFLRDAVQLATIGAAIGAIAAAGATRWMVTLLFGVSRLDPTTFAAVPLLLITVAAIAASRPAYRAASTPPLEAIREQ
jgi:predicted permease